MRNNFQFEGFTPNRKIKEESKVFYSLIERRSPSDSKKLAVLKKKGASYTARLKVSSAGACSFDISCRGHNAGDSINSLQKQFLNKILKWNQTRQAKKFPLEK